MTEKTLQAIKELKEKSKKRNFPQTFDLIINLRDINLKKSENKFSEDFVLPQGRGKETKVILFSDSIKTEKCEVLTTEEIQDLAKNKREAKKLVKQTDFFLSEPKLMPLIGKTLGVYLAPQGKMPKVVTGNAEKLVENYQKSTRIKLKDSPVIQCPVGNEKIEDKSIAENIDAVIKFLEGKLPKGKQNLGRVLLKLTMSKPVDTGVGKWSEKKK
jgi:large subunit ribosomal protein L1